MNIFTLHC